MLLPLNITGKNVANQIETTVTLNAPGNGEIQIIPFPHGAAHAPIALRHVSTDNVLTRGVDWDYCYPSTHAKATFDIVAYAGVYIINAGLTGDIIFTPNYLGGNYGKVNPDNIVYTSPIGEELLTRTWDEALAFGVGEDTTSTTPAGYIDITLDDIINVIKELADVTSDGVNTHEVITVLNTLLTSYQTNTIDVVGRPNSDVVELLNIIKSTLDDVISSNVVSGITHGGDLVPPINITNYNPGVKTQYRFIGEGEVTYKNDPLTSVIVRRGTVVVIDPDKELPEFINVRSNPLTHQPLVSGDLAGSFNDISSILNLIKERTDVLRREYTYQGLLTTSVNFSTLTGDDGWWYINNPINVTVPTSPNGDIVTLSAGAGEILTRENNLYRVSGKNTENYKIPFINPSIPGPDKTLSGELLRVKNKVVAAKDRIGEIKYGVLGTPFTEPHRSTSEYQILPTDPTSRELGELIDAQFGTPILPHADVGTLDYTVRDFTITTPHPPEDVIVHNVTYSKVLERFALRMEVVGVGYMLVAVDKDGGDYTELAPALNLSGSVRDFKVVDESLYFTIGRGVHKKSLSNGSYVATPHNTIITSDIREVIPFDEEVGFYLALLDNGDLIWLHQNHIVATGVSGGLIHDSTTRTTYYVKDDTLYSLEKPANSGLVTEGKRVYTNPSLTGVFGGTYIEERDMLVYSSSDNGAIAIHSNKQTLSHVGPNINGVNPNWLSVGGEVFYILNGAIKALSFSPSVKTYIRG